MPTLNSLFVSGLTLAAVGAGVWGVYYQYQLQGEGIGETLVAREENPEELALSNEPVASPTPSAAPLAQVRGSVDTQSVAPSPTPVATSPTPETSPAPDESSADTAAIEFIDAPSEVTAGEKFTLRWRVVGPTGASGEDTKLTVTYNVASQEGSSRSTINSNTSTSFGSFTVPKAFSSTFTFGQQPGPVAVTVTALVDGQEVRSAHTITLTE